jgi:hypothetical protein
MATGNNKLNEKQVKTFQEKVNKIKSATGNKYKKLLTLVSGCIKKKALIPYQEYKSFNKIYAEILEQEFNNKKVNKQSQKVSGISQVSSATSELDEQELIDKVAEILNSKETLTETQEFINKLNIKVKERNEVGYKG